MECRRIIKNGRNQREERRVKTEGGEDKWTKGKNNDEKEGTNKGAGEGAKRVFGTM